MKSTTATILAAAVVTCAGCGAPGIIHTQAFEARVVDESTGKPIEGANVVAIWALFEQMFHGKRFKTFLDARETVTDVDGRFAFGEFYASNPEGFTPDGYDPVVIIFKSGYEASQWRSTYNSVEAIKGAGNRSPPITGKIVKLRLFEGEPLKNEPAYIPYLWLSYPLSLVKESCGLKKMPLFVIAADAEIDRLKRMGYRNQATLPNFAQIDFAREQCGFGREYFEKYRK